VLSLILYLASEKRNILHRLPITLSLIGSLACIYSLSTGLNLISWLMLCTIFLYALLLSIQELILFFGKGKLKLFLMALLMLFNATLLLWLHLDKIFLSTAKIHISIAQLTYMKQVAKELFTALAFLGKNNYELLFELLLLAFVPIIFAIKRRDKNIAKGSQLWANFLLSLILLLSGLSLFSLSCQGISLVDYLPIRLSTAGLPLPDHPRLSANKGLAKIMNQPFTPDYDKCYPQHRLKLDKEKAPKQIVYIIIESLKREYFLNHMPRTLSYCEKGLFFNNHYSSSNGTLSGLHSIFNGSTPLNAILQPPEIYSIILPHFLKKENYESYLLTPSFYVPTAPDWQQHLQLCELERVELSTIKVMDKLKELLQTQAPKLVCAYLYNTHFNYYYPEKEELLKPSLNPETNLFLMVPNQENLKLLTNRYTNAITHADRVLGEFFDWCEQENIFKDTCFIITGDHGESLGETGFMGHTSGPHISQFATIAAAVGAGFATERVEQATTHADLFPKIIKKIGINSEVNCESPSLGYPILQFDDSVFGRIIVRREDRMSIFATDLGRLKWLATLTSDYEIRDEVALLYGEDLGGLARQIAADVTFIRSRIGSE
jgi:glucan phosphoethanolaminetransferase (alkaline phosphatase superfamily)